MKLARELSKRQTGRTLYLLDEPTTGLHFDDVRKLLEVLHRLTDLGNTIIIIEHNLDIIRNADYVLDLGPEGGEGGGRIIAHGTPEQIATVHDSHTATFLAKHYMGGLQAVSKNGTGINPNAGPQPRTITAAPDRPKDARGKFIVPPKKTGIARASAPKNPPPPTKNPLRLNPREKSSKKEGRKVLTPRSEPPTKPGAPMSRLWDMGLGHTATIFLSPTSNLPRTTEEPTIPALRPIKPILPEGEAILQPPLDNTPNEAPAEPPTRIPHLGHALLFLAFTALLLALSQLLLLSLYHTTPGRLATTIPNKPPRRLRGLSPTSPPLPSPGSSFPSSGITSLRPRASRPNPSAAIRNALRLIPLGIALSFIVQAASSFISLPKSIPIDDFFRTPSDVWIVTAFGIFLAPLFEETLFRGFLFPAFAIAYDWLCLPRTRMAGLAATSGDSSNQISNAAYIFSAVLSSVFFAALHGQQIDFAWPVLLLLFCVSLILTFVRFRLRSVLASTLVHASYNLAIFLTAFIGTGGYRHLERMTR